MGVVGLANQCRLAQYSTCGADKRRGTNQIRDTKRQAKRQAKPHIVKWKVASSPVN